MLKVTYLLRRRQVRLPRIGYDSYMQTCEHALAVIANHLTSRYLSNQRRSQQYPQDTNRRLCTHLHETKLTALALRINDQTPPMYLYSTPNYLLRHPKHHLMGVSPSALNSGTSLEIVWEFWKTFNLSSRQAAKPSRDLGSEAKCFIFPISPFAYVCIYIYTYICIFLFYKHMCICVCVCTCIYIYVCMCTLIQRPDVHPYNEVVGSQSSLI